MANKYKKGSLLKQAENKKKYSAGSLIDSYNRFQGKKKADLYTREDAQRIFAGEPNTFGITPKVNRDITRDMARAYYTERPEPPQAPDTRMSTASEREQPREAFSLNLDNPVRGISGQTTRESFAPVDTPPGQRLSQGSKPTIGERVMSTLASPFTRSDEDQQARDMNIYNISKQAGLPMDTVDKHYNEITKELGLRQTPTTQELVELGFTAAVTSGLLTVPAKVLPGLLRFVVVDKSLKEALNIAKSISTGQKYQPGSLTEFSDALPDSTNQTTRDIVDLLSFLGEAKVAGASKGWTDKMFNGLTKEILTKYNLPKTVHISAGKIKSIFQTGEKISAEEAALVQKLGLTGPQYKAAIEKGIDVEVPAEVIATLVDRPYWAKLKSILKIKPTNEVLRTEKLGSERQAPAGLLGEGRISQTTDVVPVGERTTNLETKRPTREPLNLGAPGTPPMQRQSDIDFEKRYEAAAQKVIDAEKTPDRLMDPKETELMKQNWKEYSRSRGYTEKEIADYEKFLELTEEGKRLGWTLDDMHGILATLERTKPTPPIDKKATKPSQNIAKAEPRQAEQKEVYHATYADFDSYDIKKAGSATGYDNAKWGVFFADSVEGAKEFMKIARETVNMKEKYDTTKEPIIKKEKITLKNPIDLTMRGLFTNAKQAPTIVKIFTDETMGEQEALEFLDQNIGMGEIVDFYDQLYSDINNKKIIQDAGYDGIISSLGTGKDGKEFKEYVVFDTKQIQPRVPVAKPKTVEPQKATEPVKNNTADRIRAMAEASKKRLQSKKPTPKKEGPKKAIKAEPRKVEPTEAELNNLPSDVRTKLKLEKQLTDDLESGKDEAYFHELHNKLYADYLEGKTKTDQSEIVSRFIDRTFMAEGEEFYSKESGSLDTFEKRDHLIDNDETLHTLGYKIIKKFANKASEKYIPRGNQGVMFRGTGNIAVKSFGNIPLVVHEASHAIDVRHGTILQVLAGNDKDIISELKRAYFDYYPSTNKSASKLKYTSEGLAAFTEQVLAQPSTIKKEFPNLVKEVATPGGLYNNKQYNELLDMADEAIAKHQSKTAIQRYRAHMYFDKKDEIDTKSFFNPIDKVRAAVFDYIWPMEQLGKMSNTAFTNKDVSLQLRSYNRILNVFKHNATSKNGGYYAMDKYGEFFKLLDYNWNNLIAAMQKAGVSADYGLYLIAKQSYFDNQRYLDLLKDGKEDEARKLLKVIKNDNRNYKDSEEVYRSNRKRFAELDEMYDRLTKEDLKLMNHPLVRALDNEGFKELNSRKGYASLKRKMTDEFAESSGLGLSASKSARVSSLAARKGSQKRIIHPVANSVQVHGEVLKKATRQIIYNMMLENKDLPGWKDVIQPASLEAIPSGDKFFFPQSKDPNIVFAIGKDEKIKPLIVHEDIRQIFDIAFDTRSMHALVNLARVFNRLFIKMTTALYAPFGVVTNPTIDSMALLGQTRNNTTPVISIINQMKDLYLSKEKSPEIRKYINEFFLLGGGNLTFIRTADKTPEEQFKALTGEYKKTTKILGRIANTVVNVASTPAQTTESMSRVAEYINARKAGKHQIVAMREAAMVTTTFEDKGSLGGKLGRDLISAFSYMNAPLQVSHTMLRSLENPETRNRAIFLLMALTALGLGTTAARVLQQRELETTKDPDKKEELELKRAAWESLSNWDKANYVNVIKTNGDMHRIRVPANYKILGTFIEMALANSLLNDKTKLSDYIDIAEDAFLPQQFQFIKFSKEGYLQLMLSWAPRIIKPEVTTALNLKDFPEANPIEADWMKYKLPEERMYENTNDLAIALGKTFKLSPLLIENWLKTRFGRTLMKLTEDLSSVENWLKVQKEAFINPAYRTNKPLSGAQVDRFYETYRDTQVKNARYPDKYEDQWDVVSDAKKVIQGLLELTRRIEDVPKKHITYTSQLAKLIGDKNFEEAEKLLESSELYEVEEYIAENEEEEEEE